MVRITLYDPQVSAEVYSRRRTAEQGADSSIATGLARLGRLLSERELRLRAAGSEAVGLEAALGFWEEEVGRLDELGAKIPRGKPGFHDLAMREHLARREERIAGLNDQDPAAAERFDLRTRPLIETLQRRAGAMEAGASGDGLAGRLEATLKTAVRTVQADPLQHDAIRDGLLGSLAEMEANGVDAGGLAGFRTAVERNLAGAAVGGLIGDGQFDAARELLAEGRMPGLAPEDRTALIRKVARVEAKAAADGAATTAAGIAAYWAGFRTVQATLREGGEAPGVDYADETIRRVLPEDQAEQMIALRDAAEDAGAAYGRIAQADPETIGALIAGASPKEARHLRAAARERRRRLADDPAAFVLNNARVGAAHDAWQAAVEGGDADAIAAAATVYAQASLDAQQRLGVAEASRRVLPEAVAAGMVTKFFAGEQPDPAALGAKLRTQFGDYWRPVLEDIERAGLPEGLAAIAAMDRPDQQVAAQSLSALVGTSKAELRGRIDEGEAEAVDQSLRALAPEPRAPGPASHQNGVEAALVYRRAYDLVAAGEDPATATIRAAAEIMTSSSVEAAAFKQSAPMRLAAAPKLPPDGRPENLIEAALPSDSAVDKELSMVGEIATLAERLGLDPEFLPPDSERLLDVLRGLDQYGNLSRDQRQSLDNEIRRFQNRTIEVWLPLREKLADVRDAARPPGAQAEPAENALLLENRVEELRNDQQGGRLALSRRRTAGLGPQWWTTLSAEVRQSNIDWLNQAIVGGDDLEREFAVKAVLEADQQAFDLRHMLSDNAIQGYVNYWHSSYVAGKAIDISAQADSSMRFKDLIETGISSHGLPVSRAVYRELLARISQVPYAGRDQRKALVEYIANVIMPFSETHGQNLQAAVGALSVGWKKHTPRLIDIPGPFVEFLTNSDLADYYQRRGLERLHGDQNPHVPDTFLEHLGFFGIAGAVHSIGSVFTDLSSGSIVGAGITIGDILNDIDEHDREIGDFYTKREVHWRLQFGPSSEDMRAQMDRAFPPQDPPTIEERTDESVTGNTRRQ